MHRILANFDLRITGLLRYIPDEVRPFMAAVTWLGSPSVIIAFACISAVVVYVNQNMRLAIGLVLPIIAIGGNTILKYIFQRERPDTLYVENMIIKSYSFPSGHSFSAAVFYGLLAYLAFTRLPQPYGGMVACILILIIGLVATSRVYLGAHFPSDVIAGVVLGLVSTLIIVRSLHL